MHKVENNPVERKLFFISITPCGWLVFIERAMDSRCGSSPPPSPPAKLSTAI